MGTFWDAALAVVCAAGLALLGWWLFGLLLRPLPGHGAYLVLPGRDEGEGLEQQVRALRLTARWPGVVLWPASELGDLLHT